MLSHDALQDSDFGRLDGPLWVEAALRSRHRTLDPADADFFILPVAGAPPDHPAAARTHPWAPEPTSEYEPSALRSAQAGNLNPSVFRSQCPAAALGIGNPVP